MQIECADCGQSFDTDRDADTPGATTTRCPGCGQEHDPEDVDEVATASGGGSGVLTLTVTIEVEAPDGVELAAEVQRDE